MRVEPRALLAGGFSVLGGALILANGLLVWLLGLLLAHEFGIPSSLFVIGALLGVVTIAAGVLVVFLAPVRRALGGVIVACAIASLPFAFGGFVVGFVLAMIGGTLALVRPSLTYWVRGRGPTSGSPPWT